MLAACSCAGSEIRSDVNPTLETTVENLSILTPGDLKTRHERPELPGNKEAFLRAVDGVMTKREAERFRALIDESCERIDE